MNVEKWFSLPIWYDFISQDWDAIAEYCLKLEASDTEKLQLSNVGGWHSPSLKIDEHVELQPLFASIENKLRETCQQIDGRFRLEISAAWIIINRDQAYNAPHFHPQSALSGVVYVSTPEQSGDIVFSNDSLMQHYPINTFESPLFTSEVTFKPEVGKMLVFPSWLKHHVKANISQQTRISIAFNTRQI